LHDGSKTCTFHRSGKPLWAPKRFFKALCPACELKADTDQRLRTAPTPEQCFEDYKASRRRNGQQFQRLLAAKRHARAQRMAVPS
jgi:hypothetical protein